MTKKTRFVIDGYNALSEEEKRVFKKHMNAADKGQKLIEATIDLSPIQQATCPCCGK